MQITLSQDLNAIAIGLSNGKMIFNSDLSK